MEPSDAGTVSLQIYTKRSSIQQGVFGPSWAWVLKGSPGGVRSSAGQEAAGRSPARGSPTLERLGGVVAKGVAPLKEWTASRRAWEDSGCSVIMGGAAEVGEANEGSAQ